MKRRKTQSGLTIIEILAVLVIAAIVLGIAAPFAGNVNRGFKRHASAQSIGSMIRSARTQAVSSSKDCNLNVNVNVIYITDALGNRIGKDYILPRGIALINSPTTVTFNKFGAVKASVGGNIFHIVWPPYTANVDYKDKVTITINTGQAKIQKNIREP